MPFEPWLKQPDRDEEMQSDPDDPVLAQIRVVTDPEERPVDWFIDHLEPELAEKS